jgi:3-hydroxymyristoyl/3-hydroxydecanoyl-(acyl carrier protein) dehydratase
MDTDSVAACVQHLDPIGYFILPGVLGAEHPGQALRAAVAEVSSCNGERSGGVE